MLIALYEDMISFDFGFNRLKVKVTGFKLIFAFLTDFFLISNTVKMYME